jgi:hypothetical protein
MYTDQQPSSKILRNGTTRDNTNRGGRWPHCALLGLVTGYIFFHYATAPVGQDCLITEASPSHSDTPHSVGLLWTSDQLVAETSTWQHTTFTTDRHPFEPRNSSKQAAANPRFRPRRRWVRHQVCIFVTFQTATLRTADIASGYRYFDVVVGLVWSHDPKSYAGGSVCYW